MLGRLGIAGQCWAVLGSVGQCWAVLGSVGQFWAVLGSVGQFWAILGNAGLCWAVLGSAEFLRGSNHQQKGTSCPSNQERQWSRQAGGWVLIPLSREAFIRLLHHLHQCEPHLSQGWHLFMGRRHSIVIDGHLCL